MFRRALLLLAVAGIYLMIKRSNMRASAPRANDRAAEAQWANEGGANAPASV
jgi:hypothetical protein